MVNLEKLAELEAKAGEPISARIDEAYGEIDVTVGGVAREDLPASERYAVACLTVELLNDASAIVAELRAARDLANHLRRGIDDGVLSEGGWLAASLLAYESARDGASK